MNLHFDQMRSPEVGDLVKKGGVVLVPIGACEVHGRHLPLNTDTVLASSVAIEAAKIASKKVPIAVLPSIWFGYSVNVLKNWPGTITIKPKVLIDLVYEVCRSLIDMGINKILIINGHGNNPGVLDVVVRSIGDDFKVFPGVVNSYNLWDNGYVKNHRKSKEGGTGHAGELETSLMLHLTDGVNMDLADGTDVMKSNLKSCPVDWCSGRKKWMYLSTWYLEDSKYGAAGDPSDARAEFGKDLQDMAVKNLSWIIEEFYEVLDKLAKRKLRRENTKF
jgi:creatinine amidohydrolase